MNQVTKFRIVQLEDGSKRLSKRNRLRHKKSLKNRKIALKKKRNK